MLSDRVFEHVSSGVFTKLHVHHSCCLVLEHMLFHRSALPHPVLLLRSVGYSRGYFTNDRRAHYFSRKDSRAAGVLWMELMFRLIRSATDAVDLEENDWVFISLKMKLA